MQILDYINQYLKGYLKRRCNKKKKLHFTQESTIDLDAIGTQLRSDIQAGLKEFLYNSIDVKDIEIKPPKETKYPGDYLNEQMPNSRSGPMPMYDIMDSSDDVKVVT